MICADELGPVTPRTFSPAPGWSPAGHRIKAELDYSRGPEKTWVYGGLRPADGQAVTMTASSRNSVFYQQFLELIEDANPDGKSGSSPTTCPVTTACPPGLARGPSPHPPCLHPCGCVLAQPAGRLVAHFPQSRARRPVIRQPRRHRTRHQPGNRAGQRPGKALDLGQTRAATPSRTTRKSCSRYSGAAQFGPSALPGTRAPGPRPQQLRLHRRRTSVKPGHRTNAAALRR